MTEMNLSHARAFEIFGFESRRREQKRESLNEIHWPYGACVTAILGVWANCHRRRKRTFCATFSLACSVVSRAHLPEVE
jgi:hypothetical protein